MKQWTSQPIHCSSSSHRPRRLSNFHVVAISTLCMATTLGPGSLPHTSTSTGVAVTLVAVALAVNLSIADALVARWPSLELRYDSR